MYNFNDTMVCAEPYVNLKRAGMIVGILPYGLRGCSNIQFQCIIDLCKYSEEFEYLINKNKLLYIFYNEISNYGKYKTQEMIRVFYLDGCTIFAIESPLNKSNPYYGNIITWKTAAEKYTMFLKLKRAAIKIYNPDFKSAAQEYDFYVEAMRLGTIDAIHLMDENDSASIFLHAFLRAAIWKCNILKAADVIPSFHNVMEIKDKLIKRWGFEKSETVKMKQEFEFSGIKITDKKHPYPMQIIE